MPAEAQSLAALPTEDLTGADRCEDLANQMAEHMNANPTAMGVTGRVWRGGDVVRIYTNVSSYAAV